MRHRSRCAPKCRGACGTDCFCHRNGSQDMIDTSILAQRIVRLRKLAVEVLCDCSVDGRGFRLLNEKCCIHGNGSLDAYTRI